MKELDGYVRVSQVRGRAGTSFISPEIQREQIKHWADGKNVRIAQWHEDLDQSGGKLSRPNFDVAMDRVMRGQTGGIVVAKLDRFARSLAGALQAIESINEAGGEFISVAEGIDPSNPAGKMMQRLLLTMAEYELDRYREQWQTARSKAVERGVHIASKVPTGYVRRQDGTLKPHPEYGPAVAEAFRMKAAGKSWAEIAAYLNERGVEGPYKATFWHGRAVSHVIENRVYLGEARSGEYRNPTAHEAIIDRATWELAQSRQSNPAPRKGEGALLSGILRCAGCRHLMKGDHMRMRDGTKARIYRCRGKHSTGVCESKSAALGSVIEPYIEAAFFEVVGNRTFRAWTSDEELETATIGLAEAERELAAYRDNERISGVLGVDGFVAGLELRAAKVEAAQDCLAELRSRLPQGTLDPVKLHDLWPSFSISEKRELMASALDGAFLRTGKGLPIAERTIVFALGEGPDDLPRRGRRVPLRPLDWPIETP